MTLADARPEMLVGMFLSRIIMGSREVG